MPGRQRPRSARYGKSASVPYEPLDLAPESASGRRRYRPRIEVNQGRPELAPDERHALAIAGVEVPGIEPGSFGVSPGLLRAQPALSLLGSGDHADKFTVTSPVAYMSLPVPRPYRKVSFLADAEHRGGSIPGSTDFSTLPQAARAKSVRLALALITLPRWLTSSRDILGPLLLVRRTKSKPFTPMLSCQCLRG